MTATGASPFRVRRCHFFSACSQQRRRQRRIRLFFLPISQYDGRAVRYALLAPAQGEDHVYMESTVALNRRSLPLAATLGIHTPNDLIVLGENESSTLETDWFYYSPATDLDP